MTGLDNSEEMLRYARQNASLKDVGFTKITIYDAERDYGHPREPGVAYFACHK